MNRAVAITGVALVSLAIGAVAVYLKFKPLIPPKVDEWITVAVDRGSVSFADKVIGVDYRLPDFRKPGGRVKFINRDDGKHLGYVLTLPIGPAPTSALPPKYTRPIPLGNGREEVPPTQILYLGNFDFTLKDADGFSLVNLVGPRESLSAASDNRLQGIVDAVISESLVQRTKSVVVGFTATDCNPCNPR